MKLIGSLILFQLVWSSVVMAHCPDGARLVYEKELEQNKKVEVCWNQRMFFLRDSQGSDWEEYPAVGFFGEPTVFDRVNALVGTKVGHEEFGKTYDDLLDQYFEGLQDRVVTTMVNDQVNTLSFFNSEELGKAPLDCGFAIQGLDEFTKGLFAQESQMRCRIPAKNLPQDLLKNVPSDNTVTGLVSLRAILDNNPGTKLKIRSRVAGYTKEINGETTVPLTDFYSFELILESEQSGQEGSQQIIGHCLDYDESFFSYNLAEPDNRYASSWKEDTPDSSGFSARLTDSWRIPLSVDMEEGTKRDRRGERVDTMDFGLNTGLLYKKEYSSGHRFEVAPEVGIPLIEGITNPTDVLSGSGFRSPIPDTFKINMTIHF